MKRIDEMNDGELREALSEAYHALVEMSQYVSPAQCSPTVLAEALEAEKAPSTFATWNQ